MKSQTFIAFAVVVLLLSCGKNGPSSSEANSSGNEELNNSALLAELPDLEITSVTSSKEYQGVTSPVIRIAYLNRGSSSDQKFQISFSDGSLTVSSASFVLAGQRIFEGGIPVPPPSAERYLSIPLDFLSVNLDITKDLKVMIDHEQVVNESNEENNIVNQNNSSRKPDFYLYKIQKETFGLTIGVANIGYTSLISPTIKGYCDNVLVYSSAIEILKDSGYWGYTSFLFGNNVTSCNELKFIVNSENLVEEYDVSNNSVSLSNYVP